MLCEDSVLHSFGVTSKFKWGKFRPNMAERSQRRDQFFRNKPNVWPYLRPQNALCPDIRCCCKINIPHTCRLHSLSVQDIQETSNNALRYCETWVKKCRDCSCYVIPWGDVGGEWLTFNQTLILEIHQYQFHIFVKLRWRLLKLLKPTLTFSNDFDANHLLCRIPTYDFNSMILLHQKCKRDWFGSCVGTDGMIHSNRTFVDLHLIIKLRFEFFPQYAGIHMGGMWIFLCRTQNRVILTSFDEMLHINI